MIVDNDILLLEESGDAELPDIELNYEVLNRIYCLGLKDAISGRKLRKFKSIRKTFEYQKGFRDGKKH